MQIRDKIKNKVNFRFWIFLYVIDYNILLYIVFNILYIIGYALCNCDLLGVQKSHAGGTNEKSHRREILK